MGFKSFNEKYFLGKLDYYQNHKLKKKDIYEAKQLVKVLDDTYDEGYRDLHKLIEGKYKIRTKLVKIIKEYGEEPFALYEKKKLKLKYRDEYEISELANASVGVTGFSGIDSSNPILDEVVKYCKWLKCNEEDTAYVFLFRDTFLAYTYFIYRSKQDNLYPWLISRASLKDLTGIDDFDDCVRKHLFDALEKGVDDIEEFNKYCLPRIRKEVKQYSDLYKTLKTLLKSIKQEKIVVIETGYCGTIPMLLKAIDKRVDFKMYTTAPYFFDIYKDKIYTNKYENIRQLEILYSQDDFMKYEKIENNKFYVKISSNDKINRYAISEIEKVVSSKKKK